MKLRTPGLVRVRYLRCPICRRNMAQHAYSCKATRTVIVHEILPQKQNLIEFHNHCEELSSIGLKLFTNKGGSKDFRSWTLLLDSSRRQRYLSTYALLPWAWAYLCLSALASARHRLNLMKNPSQDWLFQPLVLRQSATTSGYPPLAGPASLQY